MPSPYYPASVVLFQLHGGMVSHTQVLATPHFSPHSTAKTNDKSTNLRKMAYIGISDVVTASVYSEITHLEKLMMMMMKMIIIIISIMNKSQVTTVFHGRQKLTSTMKQRPEK